jgi:hypothetical protein
VLKGLNDNEILMLGRAIEDIGSHSGRKGSGTYCQGLVNGPSILRQGIVSRNGLADDENLDVLRQYRSWNWHDGQIGHGVPKDWRWPTRITVKGLMDLWWFGKTITMTEEDGSLVNARIRPYRLINRKFDISKGDQMNYTRGQLVAKHMEHVIESRNLLPEGVRQCKDLTLAQSHDVFSLAYDILLEQMRTVANIRRNQDITCGTVYKYLTELKKREVADGDGGEACRL